MSAFSQDSLRRTLSKELQRPLTEQIARAFDLAYRAHDGQYRDQRDPRSKRVPYIVHPVGVARIAHELLALVSLDDSFDDIISTCLTHDVLEDSEVTYRQLAESTSQRTADLVFALTKPTFSGDGHNGTRNELFLQKIADGGATASFVKICDHLHNISRPASTPHRLLEKALRKADLYIQLFDSDGLPNALKLEYLGRVEAAKKALDDVKAADTATKKTLSLSDAIEYCVETTKRKILEPHDIADAIVTVTNAEYASLDVHDEILGDLFESLAGTDQKTYQQVVTAVQSGSLDCGSLPASVRDLNPFSVDTIYFLDVSRYSMSAKKLPLCVGIKRGVAADWVTSPNLQMLAGYLCERLSYHERSRVNAIALDLARYRIDVDLADALQLQLSPPDLKNFRSLLDQAEFVRGKLVHALVYHLCGGKTSTDLPIVSSRVKSPRSISKKMLAQSIPSLGEIHDILGIRIVCRSNSEAAKIASRASKIIMDEVAALATLDENSIQSNVAESSAGYRAQHISFTIAPTSLFPISLGCEVQVRTVFQDAWARVSHDLEYKRDDVRSTSVRPMLQQLANLRDQSDELLDQLETPS